MMSMGNKTTHVLVSGDRNEIYVELSTGDPHPPFRRTQQTSYLPPLLIGNDTSFY